MSDAPFWTVGFDDERVARFDDEPKALQFAEFDSQLEDVTAIVMRHDPDGVAHIVAEFVR